MKTKYKIGDTVYCLEDCGIVLENHTYVPVRCIVVDVFTGDDEQIYYQVENDDEMLPFTDVELDEIHESKLFTTYEEANNVW